MTQFDFRPDLSVFSAFQYKSEPDFVVLMLSNRKSDCAYAEMNSESDLVFNDRLPGQSSHHQSDGLGQQVHVLRSCYQTRHMLTLNTGIWQALSPGSSCSSTE